MRSSSVSIRRLTSDPFKLECIYSARAGTRETESRLRADVTDDRISGDELEASVLNDELLIELPHEADAPELTVAQQTAVDGGQRGRVKVVATLVGAVIRQVPPRHRHRRQESL